MDWILQLDASCLRWLISKVRIPELDMAVTVLTGTSVGIALAVFSVGLIWWRGGKRGGVLAGFLAVGLLTADPLICAPLKHVIKRERPHLAFPELVRSGSRGGGYGMPSSHAVNVFLAATLVSAFYSRFRFAAYGLAALVGFSRVYQGMHYPLDVVVGALLGVGYGRLLGWFCPALWRRVGPIAFPNAYRTVPNLRCPEEVASGAGDNSPCGTQADDRAWLNLGYLLIWASCLLRWLYLSGGKMELSEDEAYQWLWSKHLALSYYSKPPMIAWSHWLSTAIWGDREFGLRFFSPLLTAVGLTVLLRFLAREASARAGCWLVFVSLATPLLGVGAILMTIDPLNVFFWTMAMVSGWKALQAGGTRWWLATGLWMGLGSLSKYTALFQWLSIALYFWLRPESRRSLRQPGIYWALAIQLVCLVPVLVWNSQNGWITLTHLHERAGLDRAWVFTTRYLIDFLVVEPLLLHPLFFAGMITAAFGIWRSSSRNALDVYLFSMGAPLFLFYLAYTMRARVQPNWIAPSILPLFALMVVYWDRRERAGAGWIRTAGLWGIAVMTPLIVLAHDTDLVAKITGRNLPAKMDPLRRLRGWSEMARVVDEERRKLEADGSRWFLIGEHYGTTSLLAFYLPGSRSASAHERPVFFRSSNVPLNQFYFWPGYRDRKGWNAVFVQQVKEEAQAPPASIVEEFESVTDLGVRELAYRGRVLHRVQLFACRKLK